MPSRGRSLPADLVDLTGAALNLEFEVRVGQELSSKVMVPGTRPWAPGVFTFNAAGSVQAAAVHLDGSIVAEAGSFGPETAFRPAKPGETVQLYATGLGPTRPVTPPGQLIANPLPLQYVVEVFLSGQQARVSYAGLVSPGLNQVNFEVPTNLPNGVYQVELRMGSVRSQPGMILAVWR